MRLLILKNILERKVNEEPEDQRISIREITISLIEIFPKTGLSLSVKHLAGVWHLELCLNKSDKKGKVKCINPDKHAPKTDHLRLGNSYFSKIGSFVLKVTTVRILHLKASQSTASSLCAPGKTFYHHYFLILKFKVAAPNFVLLFFFDKQQPRVVNCGNTLPPGVGGMLVQLYKAYLDVEWV